LKRLVYGFISGAVDVYPKDSLQDKCRDNSTATVETFEKLFVR